VVRSTRVPTAEPLRPPLEEVTFPVAGDRAGGHVGGTLGHGRHVGDLAPSIRPPRLTQRGQQCAPQGATGQHI
jgi:hypothetical protein